MTSEEYIAHYLSWKEILIFLGIAIIIVIGFDLLIFLTTKVLADGRDKEEKNRTVYEKSFNLIERFYEMIFSASSILSFLAAYYLIDRFVTAGDFRVFWDKYKDFLLLLMILLSCIINNYFDVLLVPLKKISRSEKGSIRLLGMIYIIMIFAYIKLIYENDNYDGFIMYFLGLIIGRFVYFDASFKETLQTIKAALQNAPLLIMGLLFTSIMCLYGFKTDYLLISNGVLVSVFLAHLFMVIAVFIIQHSHFMCIFIRKPKMHKQMLQGEEHQRIQKKPRDL